MEELVSRERVDRLVELFRDATGDPVAVLPGFTYAHDDGSLDGVEDWRRIKAVLDRA
jgi:hypothetical protein